MKDGFITTALDWHNFDSYYHRSSIFRKLKQVLDQLEGSLLDVGCGKMPYKNFVLENSKVAKYIGLDIETALIYDDKVKPDLYWDGIEIPIEDSSINCVIATEVLEHCPDPMVTLNEISRVLQPGGIFFLTVPFLWNLHESPHDYYRYTPYALEHLLMQSGFTEIKIEALGGWHASMAQMMGLWLKRSFRRRPVNYFLYLIFYPFYKILLKLDKTEIKPNSMITGLSATAIKNR